MKTLLGASAAVAGLLLGSTAMAAPAEPLYAMVKKEQPAVVETLRQIVNIESGSRDKAGLDQLAALLAERLAALGSKIEIYEPNSSLKFATF
jgi:glutamate carboxypeptidase